jgi:TonB family protein
VKGRRLDLAEGMEGVRRQVVRLLASRIGPTLGTIANLSWTQRRDVALFGVIGLHAALIVAIILALRISPPERTAPEMFLTMSPGGPSVPIGAPPNPKLAVPEAAVAPPELIVADDAPQNAITLPMAAGPAVTAPAEAIGDTHSAPPLSGPMLAAAHRGTLRLLLTVASDGSIAKAVVESSSGLEALDTLAVAWVEAHWRYKPALQNGHAIAETTIAIMPL